MLISTPVVLLLLVQVYTDATDAAALYLDCSGVAEFELFVYKTLLKPPERSFRLDVRCDQSSPVCGTDLKTYDDPCNLRYAQKYCPNLRMLHPGPCVKPGQRDITDSDSRDRLAMDYYDDS